MAVRSARYEVLARCPGPARRPACCWLRRRARRQAPAHLLQLGAGRHLLGEQRRLDAVEQALQPADELGLRDPQLGVGRDAVLGERQADSRCSSSRSSGASPSSSSLMEFSWISLSRLREASSSGAARTSSSSCLIIVPIRMTLAGCSTMLPTPCSSSPSSAAAPGPCRPAGRPARRPSPAARRSRPARDSHRPPSPFAPPIPQRRHGRAAPSRPRRPRRATRARRPRRASAPWRARSAAPARRRSSARPARAPPATIAPLPWARRPAGRAAPSR